MHDSVSVELCVAREIRLRLSIGIAIGLEVGLNEGDKAVSINEGETLGSKESWVGFFNPDDADGGNNPKVTVVSRSSTTTMSPRVNVIVGSGHGFSFRGPTLL